MNLKDLITNIATVEIDGNINVEIEKIEYDSRKVSAGDLFVCIEGFKVDGHKFAQLAVNAGATAIICSKPVEINSSEVTVITVEDSRAALAKASANFFGNPEAQLKIIGITGTNGKTTSAFMIKSILEAAGYKTGLIGTIANYIGNKVLHTERTTPESLELFGLFKDMLEAGVQYCVMEVSSHSLVLNRVYGIQFSQGIFTNLTQDHLDFHETFENYYKAKFMLFENSKNSIINIDDSYGKEMFEALLGKKAAYSIEGDSNFKAENVVLHSRGAIFNIKHNGNSEAISIHLPGKYNVYNALGCIAACLEEGISIGSVVKGLDNMHAVPGRCEIVTKAYNLGYDIIVDYAHTPDGLENILKTAREFTAGRLISIYGCGGDRDKTKRPIMGKIGTELSDIAIITSDNPRSEDPSQIIKDILAGVEKDNYTVVEDRRDAIKVAMSHAKAGDIIVLAGKGHEDYQVLKDKTIHFDEREVVADLIKELY